MNHTTGKDRTVWIFTMTRRAATNTARYAINMISDDRPRPFPIPAIARRECMRPKFRRSLFRGRTRFSVIVYPTGAGTSKAVSQKRRSELIIALATAPAIWLGLEFTTTAPTTEVGDRVGITPPPVRPQGKAKGPAPVWSASALEGKVSDVSDNAVRV